MAICITQYTAKRTEPIIQSNSTKYTMPTNANPSKIFANVAITNPPYRHGQQGMALLTILLLVVAITIVAGSMLANQKVMIREFELTKGQGQLREYALAGEAMATNLIAQDSQVNQVDSLTEAWAKPLAEQTINQAKVSIKIDDDASRFNVNNLYHDGKVDDTALAFFQALLQANGLSPNIAMAVLDWQDPDSDTRADGGAEAAYYQSTGKKMAMAIANQPFISINELQHVRGMDSEGLQKLAPYLTAVPYYLPMNINTVKPELLTILVNLPTEANGNQPQGSNRADNDGNPQSGQDTSAASNVAATHQIDDRAIINWANARENNLPVQTLTQLWAVPSFAQIDERNKARIAKLLATQSQSFRVVVSVKSDDKQLFLHSQIAKILPKADNDPAAASGVSATPIPAPVNTQNGTQNNTLPQIITYNRQFLPFAQ
ncbi:type II secretion system minor pseudopilin GspK [Moraxella osloensis]|uniref:type II secretion system minor pseudopilin GspK n=1 Tax=Faucicola osloensis TaxID=34062 RepID=UPI002005F13F|nr:type II secretion system minor pseudopilin GspK [Moraxella osloensis]